MLAVLADAEFGRRAERPRRTIAAAVRSPLAGVSVHRSYTTAVRQAAGVLARAGHRVRRAEPPYPLSLGVTALQHWTAGTAVDAAGLDPARLARRTRVHAAVGRRFVRPVRTGDARERLRARLTPFLTEYDVLLTPRAGPALPRRPARGTNAAGCATCWPTPRIRPSPPPWNLTGWPAMSVPAGTLPSGAPCAVQLVGLPGHRGRTAGAGGGTGGAEPVAADGARGRPVMQKAAGPRPRLSDRHGRECLTPMWAAVQNGPVRWVSPRSAGCGARRGRPRTRRGGSGRTGPTRRDCRVLRAVGPHAPCVPWGAVRDSSSPVSPRTPYVS